MKNLSFYRKNWLILTTIILFNLINIGLIFYSGYFNQNINYKYSIRQDRANLANYYQGLRDNVATTRNIDTDLSRKILKSFTLEDFNRNQKNFDLTIKYKDNQIEPDLYWSEVLNFYNNIIASYSSNAHLVAGEIYKLNKISNVVSVINLALTIILFPINLFITLILNKRYEDFIKANLVLE